MVPSIRVLAKGLKSEVRTRPRDPVLVVFAYLVRTVVAADAVAGGSFRIFSLVEAVEGELELRPTRRSGLG
jgi:hypothetical protein